jgi:hypothetical protein
MPLIPGIHCSRGAIAYTKLAKATQNEVALYLPPLTHRGIAQRGPLLQHILHGRLPEVSGH